MDGGDDSNGFGSIHVVDTASRKVRTILAATAGHFRGYPGWSPDGSLISYDDWVDFERPHRPDLRHEGRWQR